MSDNPKIDECIDIEMERLQEIKVFVEESIGRMVYAINTEVAHITQTLEEYEDQVNAINDLLDAMRLGGKNGR